MSLLSSSNRAQLGYKLEGVYPSFFGSPRPGNGTKLNMLSEALDYAIKNESSKVIRSDRQRPDTVQVGATSSGNFAFEHQYREYDVFIQAAMQSDFVEYGTAGLSGALPAITATSTTLTAASATSGLDSWATLAKGQWFSIIPAAGDSAAVKKYLKSRAFKTHSSTAATTTVITLDASTPIDTSIVTAAILAGAKIGTSYAFNGNLMKSYTLEVGHEDIGQYRQYTGMVCSKMSVKLSVGSIVTGSFDFQGKGFNLLSASGNGTAIASQTFTPANATRGIFDIFEAGVPISTTTYIKSGEFSIDNSLRIQDAIGVFGAAGIGAGTMQINGKLEVYFADAVIYGKFIAGSSTSLTIPVLDVDGNGYVYVFPYIKYTAVKVNAGGLDQDTLLSMDWEALLDPNPASPTYGKSVAIYRVGNTYSGSLAVVTDTRPRFGYAGALLSGDATGLGALFASMTTLSGSTTDRNGSFNTVSSSTNYTWIAVLASAAGASVRFFDGTGYGGFSGAGVAGINSSPSEIDPTTVHLTYTDTNGNVWNMYRSDGKAVTYSSFTLS